ncbi:MAG: cytochrome c oxidase subunit II transmembrane domain-containing protein [bacterium]
MKERHQTISRTTQVIIALALILIPTIALAVPGSGAFVSNQAPSGRLMTDLYNIIAWICLGILILVESVLLIAIFKFRRKSDADKPAAVHGNLRLEVGWTLAAAIVQVFIGVKTLQVMSEVEVIPQTTMTVEAIGYQWGWQFRYPDLGGMVSDDLVVPAHTNVKLEITSRDVIHSLFIPELGVKMDAVPGRFNLWWFNADGPVNQVVARDAVPMAVEREDLVTTRPDIVKMFKKDDNRLTGVYGLEGRVSYLAASRKVGDVSPYAKYDAIEYRGMCTEICGKGHYNMYFRTVAMTETSFKQWVKDMSAGSKEADGAVIYSGKCSSYRCRRKGIAATSHPDWHEMDQRRDAEDAHIEVVLAGSKASTLAGPTDVNGTIYNGVMQPWADQLNDVEVAAVVNHERTSWGNNGGLVTDEDVARVRAALGLPPYPAGGGEPISESDLMREGKTLYESCAGCHGNEGKGLTAVPTLVGNPTVLSDVKGTIASLVNGQDKPEWPGAHSPMGRTMTDRQLSALLTYVRKSWGNAASVVTPDEVGRLRSEVQK